MIKATSDNKILDGERSYAMGGGVETKPSFIKKKRFLTYLLKISIAVLVAAFLWVSTDGYHRLLSKELIKQSAVLVETLSPVMDEEALANLSQRKNYSISEADDYFKSGLITPQLESSVKESSASGSGLNQNE